MAGGGWQPIETAPRDDVRVLLAGGKMYCEALEEYVTAPMSAQWFDDYWLVGGTEGGYVCLEYQAPTHWMHLPEPPEGI